MAEEQGAGHDSDLICFGNHTHPSTREKPNDHTTNWLKTPGRVVEEER